MPNSALPNPQNTPASHHAHSQAGSARGRGQSSTGGGKSRGSAGPQSQGLGGRAMSLSHGGDEREFRRERNANFTLDHPVAGSGSASGGTSHQGDAGPARGQAGGNGAPSLLRGGAGRERKG
jgi:hypothetical protein